MALKPCKECGAEISSKAYRCPSCGVYNPTLDGKKAMQGCLITLFGLGILIALPFMGSDDSSNTSLAPQAQIQTSAEVQNALDYIKGLDWVKDAIYQDYAAIQWQVGILDDGRNPAWAAQSICDMLSLRDLVNSNTNVRMVDIKKVSRGEDFRKASLGRVNCVTGEQSYP